MASFTDIIPKFNPYIQQLPVEAMVKVGMAKQQAYEQNVTKIQSTIDAIGGLDVTRPVDRKYLQSKIDQLGSKLATMASGDFSNFQLVNAVGGMTNQIVKDDVIQTAVNSTAWGRKQREKIEKGKSDGTWSVENEDLYNTQYSKWYNGEQAGEAFSSEYVPYRDVYKKLREIAKDVGVDESIVQNLFKPDGTVNEVMIETHTKGRDANKIYEAFVNGIDESDYRQLAITGRYKYKGYTNEQLIETLTATNNEYVTTVTNKKLDLQQKLKELESIKLTTKKEEDLKKIAESEVQINNALLKLDEGIKESETQLQNASEKLLSGDETYANSIRARIHTNKFLTTLSKDFSDKSSIVKYAENPLWQAMMEQKKFALESWYKHQNVAADWARVRNEQARIGLESQRIEIERQKLLEQQKTNKLFGQMTGLIPTTVPGSKPVAVTSSVQESVNSMITERQKSLEALALQEFGGDKQALEKYVNSMLVTNVYDYKADKNGKFVGTKPSGKTREEIIAAVGNQEYLRITSILNDKTGKYKDALATTPQTLIQATINVSRYNKLIDGFQQGMKQGDANAALAAGTDAKTMDKVRKELAGGAQITVNKSLFVNDLKEDKTYDLSAEDITDLLLTAKKGWFSSKAVDAEAAAASKRLATRWNETDREALENYFWSADLNPATGSSWATWLMPSNIIAPIVNPILEGTKSKGDKVIDRGRQLLNSTAYEKYYTAREAEYEKIFSGYYSTNSAFVMDDKTKPVVGAKLSAIFTGSEYFKDEEQLASIVDNSKQVVLTANPPFTGIGETGYTVTIIGKDGKTQVAPISAAHYTYLAGEPPPQTDLEAVLLRTKLNNNGTSNPKGIGTWETAFFSGNEFYNIGKYNIGGGDVVRSPDNPETYYPVLYLGSSGGRDYKPVHIRTEMSLSEALAFPSNITDQTLRSMGF